MRKVLAILLVALLSVSAVFATVNFSGSATAGYQFNYNNDDWTTHLYGDDGDDTNTGSINLSIGDDDGLWTVTMEGAVDVDGSGDIAADVVIDLAKLIMGKDTDWSLTAGIMAHDRSTTLRAYSNQSGNNYDRVRTADGGYYATVTFGYSDLVRAQFAVNPELVVPDKPTNQTSPVRGDLTASVLVTPISGLGVSVDYALNGDDGDDATDNGLFGVAFDLDLGAMLDLDFSLGVSASERFNIEYKQNTFAATVYGGVDLIDVAVEYAFIQDQTDFGTSAAADVRDYERHYLWAGVNLNLIDDLGITLYTGANDLEDYTNTYFVGGEVSYTVKGITFALGIEYSEADSNNYDNAGFNIVPSIAVSW